MTRIETICSCGQVLKAKPALAGVKDKCPGCGQTIRIPTQDSPDLLSSGDEPSPANTTTQRIRVQCVCGQKLKAKPAWAGISIACPSCGVSIRIPDSDGATPNGKHEPIPAGATVKGAVGERSDSKLEYLPELENKPIRDNDGVTHLKQDDLEIGQRQTASVPPVPPAAVNSPVSPRFRDKRLLIAMAVCFSIFGVWIIVDLLFVPGSPDQSKLERPDRNETGDAGENGALSADEGSKPGNSDVPATTSAVEATFEESQQFATFLKDAIEARDTISFNRRIDLLNIARTAVEGLDIDKNFRQKFITRVLTSAQQNGGIANQIISVIKSGGSYQFVAIMELNGQHWLVFRFLSGTGDLNYHKFRVKKYSDGKIYATNLFIASEGDTMSAIFRNAFATDSRQKLNDPKILDAASRSAQRMVDLIRVHLYEAALDEFEKLPPEFKHKQVINVLRLRAGIKLGGPRLRQVVDDLEKEMGDDQRLDLLMVEALRLTDQYEKALIKIDRLAQTVGDDPYLNVERSKNHLGLGNFQHARDLGARAVADVPEIPFAYWPELYAAASMNDFAFISKRLQEMAKRFQIDLSRMLKADAFDDFRSSPQYQEWLQFDAKS